MHPLLRIAPALLGPVTTGPPLSGIRLVIPLPAFLVDIGAHLEIGFERGRLVVRFVRSTPSPAQPAWVDASWADPDDDLGPHDAWAKY